MSMPFWAPHDSESQTTQGLLNVVTSEDDQSPFAHMVARHNAI